LKTYRVVSENFSDKEVLGEDFLDRVTETFGGMSEFVGMLNDVCMPDNDDTSDSDDDEVQSDEE
jgi:hypothetical protein